ncbi:hypothetical protein JCM8547_005917 [Rhodosporidiobolus lusitaniae]
MARGPTGMSQRAKEIVQEAYNDRDNLPEDDNLTKVIQQRITAETGEEYNKEQVNHVLRKLPNYEKRAAGHRTAAVPKEVRDLMYQGWRKNQRRGLVDATNKVVSYVQEHSNPRYTPTYQTVKSAIVRWNNGRGLPAPQQQKNDNRVAEPYTVTTRSAADSAPTVLTNPMHVSYGPQGPLPEVTDFSYPDPEDHHADPSKWAAPPPHAYPTPDILYFDHNLRILQPHEVAHLSYTADGHLVDAQGYPVTTQQL